MVNTALEAFIGTLPQHTQDSAEAALAKSLAQTIDHGDTSATAKANLAKVLVELLDRLRELAPSEDQEDKLDDIRKRLAGRTAA